MTSGWIDTSASLSSLIHWPNVIGPVTRQSHMHWYLAHITSILSTLRMQQECPESPKTRAMGPHILRVWSWLRSDSNDGLPVSF